MKLLKLAGLIAAVATLAACNGPVNSNCAGLGAIAGAALGAVSENDIAQSAIVGGVAGAVAADQGMCR